MNIENRAILENRREERPQGEKKRVEFKFDERSRESAEQMKARARFDLSKPRPPFSPVLVLMFLLGLACLMQAAGPATVVGNFMQPGGLLLSTNISFTPVRDQPVASGTNLFNLAAKSIQTTNGLGRVQLYLGRFRVQIGNNVRDSFLIDVPDTTNTYQINDLLSTALTYTFPGSTNAAYEVQANKGAALGYAPLDADGLIPSAYLPAGLAGSAASITDDDTGEAIDNLEDDDTPQSDD